MQKTSLRQPLLFPQSDIVKLGTNHFLILRRSPALDRSAGEQSTLRVPGATGRSGLIAVQMATHFLYSRLVDTSVPTLKESIAKG